MFRDQGLGYRVGLIVGVIGYNMRIVGGWAGVTTGLLISGIRVARLGVNDLGGLEV